MPLVKTDSIKNTIITYTGIGLGYINKGLLFPLLLLPEQVGLLNILIILAAFFGQLSSFGTGMIIMRFLPKMKGENDKFSGLFFYSLSILLVGILLISTTIFLFEEQLINYYGKNSVLLSKYLFWVLPLGISNAIFILLEHFLRAISKSIFSVLVQDFVLRIFIFISLVIFYFDWISFNDFAFIFLLINLLPSIFLVIYLIKIEKFYIHPKSLTIGKKYRRSILKYGLFVHFNTIGRNIILIADTSMLSAMDGLKSVGIFTTMTFLSNALFVPYVALIRNTAPVVPRLINANKMDELNDLSKKISSIGFFITFSLFSITWLSIDPILSFLPKEYMVGKYVFLFLMMGKLFDAIGGINGDILLNSKKYKLDLIITIPLILLTIGSNFWLIPIYGAIGAALATSMVYLVYNILRLSINIYYFKINPFDEKLFKLIIGGVFMLGLAMILKSLVSFEFEMLIGIILPFSLYIFPIYYFRLIPDISDTIDSFIKRK